MRFGPVVVGLLVVAPAFAAEADDRYLAVVRRAADALLENRLDVHGPVKSGMIPSVLDQAESIRDAYTKVKLPVELIVVPGGGHGGSVFYSGDHRRRVTEFFRAKLGPASPPNS